MSLGELRRVEHNKILIWVIFVFDDN